MKHSREADRFQRSLMQFKCQAIRIKSHLKLRRQSSSSSFLVNKILLLINSQQFTTEFMTKKLKILI